jgi:hypothetical protein
VIELIFTLNSWARDDVLVLGLFKDDEQLLALVPSCDA